jgi:hypothetical protein
MKVSMKYFFLHPSQNNVFISMERVEKNSDQRIQSNIPISTVPIQLEGDKNTSPQCHEGLRAKGWWWWWVILN